jgi:hypothetical protein
MSERLLARPKFAELKPWSSHDKYKQLAPFGLPSFDCSPICSTRRDISDSQAGQKSRLLVSVFRVVDKVSDSDLNRLIQNMSRSENGHIGEDLKQRFHCHSIQMKSIIGIVGIFVDKPKVLVSERCLITLLQGEKVADAMKEADIGLFKMRTPDFGNWLSESKQLKLSNLFPSAGEGPDHHFSDIILR